MRAARNAPRLLLLAVAGLARERRRGQHVGLRSRPGAGRKGTEELRRVSAPQSGAPGARTPDRVRVGRAHLVRYSANDDAGAWPALRGYRPIAPALDADRWASWDRRRLSIDGRQCGSPRGVHRSMGNARDD